MKAAAGSSVKAPGARHPAVRGPIAESDPSLGTFGARAGFSFYVARQRQRAHPNGGNQMARSGAPNSTGITQNADGSPATTLDVDKVRSDAGAVAKEAQDVAGQIAAEATS